MKALRTAVLGLAAATLIGGAAQAQTGGDDQLKIGLMLTLSGPAAVLGQQAQNGFMLALEQMGGELGGIPAEVIVKDDELQPDVAVFKARELVRNDKVDFVVGPIFSNIFNAIADPVTDANVILISPNAGASTFAGEGCRPNIFVTSYQNDQVHAVMGQYARDKGYGRVFLMAPNYQAGKDSIAGFKSTYEGEIVNEIYVPLGQLDFSAELAQIMAMQPDAVFAFIPGGMGINLVKQYRQAGLASIPFLSTFTVDETTLPAIKDAGLGFMGAANWAPDMDNPQSKAFVKSYVEKYGAVPGTYAMQGYDTALLLDAAIGEIGGDLSDIDAVRGALETADFQSLRGDFEFGPNHYPIQDFYVTTVAKRPDGLYQTEIVEKVFDDNQDSYAAACKMPE